MTDEEIFYLASEFRRAIESARDTDAFKNDIFNRFPIACCGDASELLGEFLQRHNVETVWTSMERDGSHSWLVVKDYRIKEPIHTSYKWPAKLWDTLKNYGIEDPKKPIDTTHYEGKDLCNGLIIDITADQFPDYDTPVYVGIMDWFHKEFVFNHAYDFGGLETERLRILYGIIEKRLQI